MIRTRTGRSFCVGLVTIAVSVLVCGLSRAATQAELGDFLAKIQDKNGDVRRGAWEGAGNLGAEAVVPLGKILGGEDRAAAKAAERALEVVAHYASRPGADAERKAVSGALIELAKKGNPAKVRDKALRLLGSTAQDESVPAIAAFLTDEEVWEAARWALERIPGKAANGALIQALSNPPAWEKLAVLKFQEAIISTLGAKGAPEALEPLIELAQSEQEDIRIAAVEALGRIENERAGLARASQVILNVASLKAGRERAYALDALLRIADRLTEKGRAKEALAMYQLVLERFKDDTARCAAVVGIGKLGGVALRMLMQALTDESPRVRDAAVNSLTEMKGENVGRAIAASAGRANPDLKPLLLGVLVKRKDANAARALATAAGDKDENVRLAVLELMGKLGDPRLAPRLLQAAQEGAAEEKKVAVRSYLQIADEVLLQGNMRAALRMYHEGLSLATDDPERRSALQGIAAVASPESLETVKPLMGKAELRDDASRAYIAIASTIGASGRKQEAIRMLMQVVDSPCSVEVLQQAASSLKKLGVTIPIAERAGFVTRWRLVGPFPNPDNSAWETAFPPEEKVDLTKGVEFQGKTLPWKEVITDNLQGRVNLEDQFDPDQHVAAYAYTELESPGELQVKFKIGSDDSVACWLNGKKIHAFNGSRGLTVDQDVVDVTLKQGTNTILMKILNESGPWEFCLRITDSQDRPVDVSKLTK